MQRLPQLMRAMALALVWLGVHLGVATYADGPADNVVGQVRRIPPNGIAVPEEVRKELTERTSAVRERLRVVGESLQAPAQKALLPDIEILHKAVDWALRYDEFYKTNEFDAARRLLDEANRRIDALHEPRPYWTRTGGLVVRGYVSRIDGSVQPYGLVIPDGFEGAAGHRYRLDFWFHGRGEQLTELAFLDERMRRLGEFAPAHTIVLHPFGRYCNGSRFAGETDAWEALADVEERYPIDTDRILVRGFSLGGASCWHMAVHHAWRWAAAAPGAGFSETAEFLRVFQKEALQPPWWEQKLWRLYDATEHAVNLHHVPLVAYSGEVDAQIQAARAMEKAMAAEGLLLTHIVGPKTAHRYEPNAKAEINRRIDLLAERGRERLPRRVRFVTHSLRYNQMAWVILDGLQEHWEPARVSADIASSNTIRVTTTNVSALTFQMDSGLYPFPLEEPSRLEIDGQVLVGPRPGSDLSWRMSIHREGSTWAPGPAPSPETKKRHGLQGPIDDAFMDAFLFVRPTGSPSHANIATWVERELEHAREHWRRHFRGDALIKDDTAITAEDIQRYNLILWGDPQSNQLLARLKDQLPLRWDAEELRTPSQTFDSSTTVPVLIFPNPLNTGRYVVLNSGFTFREYDYLNNARQTPKLPDWAMIDVTSPVTSRASGRVIEAGFFDEAWNWKTRRSAE